MPTLAESGLANLNIMNWYGVFAPGNMPKDVLNKLSREVARIVNLPEMSEKLSAQGATRLQFPPLDEPIDAEIIHAEHVGGFVD